MQTSCGVPDLHNVVMDASGFNECTLTVGDKVINLRAEAACHHFGNDLWDDVNQADRPEVRYGGSPIYLWQEGNVGRVDDMEVAHGQLRKGINYPHKVRLDDLLAGGEESRGKTIRHRGLVFWHVLNSKPDLLHRKRQGQVVQLQRARGKSLPI